MHQTLILTHEQIQHKIRRIAYQIYETFVDEPEIIIAGINGNGFALAQEIAKNFKEISPIKYTVCELRINKKDPMAASSTSIPKEAYANKAIVLIDDVLHSGTTLIYGVKHFLETPIKKLKTAVLVDRNHKKYPIKADFKGLSLSTSLQDHVTVCFDENHFEAFLS